MSPRGLLLSGRLGHEAAGLLARLLPQLPVRAPERPSADDLEWADAFSGFAWPESPGPVAFDWVHAMGAGVDGFVGHAGQIGTLTRTVGGMPERMGTFVLALLLEHAHHLGAYADDQGHRRWRPQEPLPLPKRAAVLGTGAIASGIARVLDRHGIRVIGVNRSGAPAEGFGGVVPWHAVEEALEGCDLLVAALPGSSATAGIIDRNVLGRLRGAQFVNVGRGCTLDVVALRTALTEGWLSRAHLDVFETEPPDTNSWLWTHPAVRITPHVAALTTVDDVVDAIVTTFEDLSRGVPPRLLVDRRRVV